MQEFKEYRDGNRIKTVPLRTEELLLQYFQRSGHDGQRRIPRCEGPGRPLSYTGHSIADTQLTPNQVLNRSCMVAIPMQNKREILNNER